MKPHLLELRSVRKLFSQDFPLAEISLSLEPGVVHILVGQNGSGKSALMGLVAGQAKLDGGGTYSSMERPSISPR